MWQKCPICDGEGRVTSNGSSSSVHQVCPTCNGAKIISELNGLPPNNSIELPSDEEVEKARPITLNNPQITQDLIWMMGAKWMKEQILNQNK